MEKTKTQRRKQTKKAREKREKDAKINDDVLENKINEIPGLTYVQLEKVFAKNEFKFFFKTSYLKNALQRLEDDKKIINVLSISKDGKIVKTYESYDSKQKLTNKNVNQIIIPTELIVDKKKWKNLCFIYAIKNNEFIITPERVDKIEDKTFYKSTTKLNKSDYGITIILPGAVVEYYQLDRDNINWSIENDIITILVTPKLRPKINKKSDEQKKILLLEDNHYWGDIFYKEFTNAGHIVFRAEDFEIAEEIVKKQKIDWLVLDDEIKLTLGAQRFFVKFKKKNKKIHGIFITAYPITKKKRDLLKQLGFESIIEKKVDGQDRDPEVVAAEQLVRIAV